MQQDNLLFNDNPQQVQAAGPVTCLGKTFANDQARREYFLALLAKKLKDPNFRKVEGFPTGSDEAILNLSDPPYYTACPNPFINDFIDYNKNNDTSSTMIDRVPLSIDASVGKSDPVYKAHSYHTKVPHLAIVPSILHYTDPDDIILDGFCGSGMTGIAAQWCAIAPAEYKEEVEKEWNQQGKKSPKWGSRKVVLNDLSPAATFISANYNFPFDINEFVSLAEKLINEVRNELEWVYCTNIQGKEGDIDFTVWSDVFSCPECSGEIVFYENALDEEKKVKDTFLCDHCGAELNKKTLELLFDNVYDKAINRVKKKPRRKPVLIKYTLDGKKGTKKIDAHDLQILKNIDDLAYPKEAPVTKFPDMQMMRVGRMKTTNVEYVHDLFLPRTIQVLSKYFEKVNKIDNFKMKKALKIIAQHQFINSSIMNRYRPASSFGNSPLTGVFYVSSLIAEANVFDLLQGSINRIKRMGKTPWASINSTMDNTIISTGDVSRLSGLRDNSIDYIFTDPPFGENIYYSDLNFLVESWYGVISDSKPEAIIDRVKNKTISEYQKLMHRCFSEYYRVLKPGRWITIVFSNSRASVWNAIQVALQQVGFVVAEVTTLDKVHLSFQQIMSPNAVKQDLVISAYKPKTELEKKVIVKGGTEDLVWDFVNSHLTHLSNLKINSQQLEFVVERDPRVIFDRTVAWFVRHKMTVPLSMAEFQTGLAQRFIERDGMYFLSDQVAKYDKVKLKANLILQPTLFVNGEASAIDWIRGVLTLKPQTFADISPLFMQQLSGWSKHEVLLDLRELLKQNFLCYDGDEPVPEQIHIYLSSNWKELRNLSKNDPILVAKAQGRWYVPDPNKKGDLEKLREKSLLKEFEEYKEAKKKLKVFRIEAVRIGFKKLWEQQEYPSLIAVADKLPSNVLEEDPVLLMYYDQAVTLSQVDSDDEW
ncbi:site-specific DNA-methyltransferase [Citrobacter freundii]|uniref:Site-specific DNA-methyltransferase n=1 Tax=Citrobacter freundii TaxID=546 RepID=A0AAP6CNN3_CITFR|nr:site-specific DNA-methyltransferase [Citrobacter freundii]MCW0939644.1 site-specific DNA-methyltransferase [Citrobacter freundii]MDV2190691.1 site-specific DNA-methyltransferase [Citrobacter freundii]MDW2757617.1 site-specific DNA-methyltransferase [Citrobacter freundii]MEB0532970.1 site-specific DNA-methyltransferase [Citrobacter freundii]WHW86475.1 site-specific DNA-methyltransferase [Citrobacter freundii]